MRKCQQAKRALTITSGATIAEWAAAPTRTASPGSWPHQGGVPARSPIAALLRRRQAPLGMLGCAMRERWLPIHRCPGSASENSHKSAQPHQDAICIRGRYGTRPMRTTPGFSWPTHSACGRAGSLTLPHGLAMGLHTGARARRTLIDQLCEVTGRHEGDRREQRRSADS